MHPSGSPLIVGNNNGTSIPQGRVSSFNITATTATAAAGSPFITGDPNSNSVVAKPFSSVFSRGGNHLYAGGNGNALAVFSVNPANGVSTALAGALVNSGTLTLTNSAIYNNSAQNGGGLATVSGGTTNLTSVTISGNSANQFGGGIYHGNNAAIYGDQLHDYQQFGAV